MGALNRRLRALRERANPALSGRAMADKLGLSKSAYHLYESDGPGAFKQRYLPMDLARRIAAILADHGVDPDEVMALAGVGIDELAKPELSATEVELIERYRELDKAHQKFIWQTFDLLRRPPEREPVSAPARPARRAENKRPANKSSNPRGLSL